MIWFQGWQFSRICLVHAKSPEWQLGSHFLMFFVKWGQRIMTFCISLCRNSTVHIDASLPCSEFNVPNPLGSSFFTENVQVYPDKLLWLPNKWESFLPILFYLMTSSLVATIMLLSVNERALTRLHLGLLCTFSPMAANSGFEICKWLPKKSELDHFN